MEKIIECIIAGGPQHGESHYQQWNPECTGPVTLTVDDGAVCIAAAHGPANPHGPSYILLHPLAVSGQLAALLALRDCHRGSACDAVDLAS